jgi:hypothetical protein
MLTRADCVVMCGHDGRTLDQHEQLPSQDLGIGGSGALGDAGQQLQVAAEMTRGDGAYGLDLVLGGRDSCWSLVSERERQWYTDVTETGYAVRPLPFFDGRATPHPLASLLQPLRLTGDPARDRRRVYVYAAGWDGESPFTPVYQRLREDSAWKTYALDGGHNLMRDAPQDLLKILLEAVRSR